jgi:serine/threonine-protein kinase
MGPEVASAQPAPGLPPIVTKSMAARMEATQLVRPPPSRWGVIGTGVAFAGLAAGLVLYLMMPHTGRITINVADQKGGATLNHVEIFVDGKKQCDTAPCIVDQVSAGTHQVKVLAQGYETPADHTVTVDARKDTAVDLSLAASSVKGTGIKVSGSQPGVKLYVDGKEIGPLPQELRDLTPGDHKIRLAGTDRYAPFEKNVIVAEDEVHDLGDQTLKVVKGKATITLGTTGAKVSIVSGTDRREFPTLPIAVDLDTTKPWALEASRPGFTDYHQTVTFDDGVAEKTFNIVLEPKVATTSAQATLASTTPITPVPVIPKPVVPVRAAPPAKEATEDSAPKTEASGDSFLNINSIPASSVVLDGKPIGNTPKVHISVTPGNHTVMFVNSDQGLKKQISVSVGAGETKPAIARLRD